MDEKNLGEIRSFLQWLLDKYLEPEQRFSLDDLDEEMLFLLIDLFLEKDDLERERLWEQVRNKLIKAQEWLRNDYEKIMEIKNRLIMKKLERQEEQRLKELDDLEKEFDEKLSSI